MKNTRRRRRGQASNVFCDLGFGPGESASLTLRSDLMIALTSLIRLGRANLGAPQATLRGPTAEGIQGYCWVT